MYMNVQEFRSNLKKHLDDAVRGEPVIIERGGVQFTLLAAPKGVGITHASVTPQVMSPQSKVEKVIMGEGTPSESIKFVQKESKLCKIHGTPLDQFGYCTQKKCKYAR